MKVKFQLLSTGYCESNQSHVVQGLPQKKIKFRATIGLIKHPKHGVILFDTGYTDEFYSSTKKYPYKLYKKITPVFHNEKESAKSQLLKMGISSDAVKYIIVSHFHADHICGLNDFKKAQFVCSKNAYQAVKNLKGFFAVKKGFLPQLMPIDFEKRSIQIDFQKNTKEHQTLDKTYDLFKDNSILLYDISGHADGQMGCMLNTNSGNILLIADAAWVEQNYMEMKLPNPIVKLFFSSWSNFKNSLGKIHKYYNENPKSIIIPTHCTSSWVKLKEKVF